LFFLFLFVLGGCGGVGRRERVRKGTYSACSEEEAIMESSKLKIWSDLKGKVVLVASAVQDLGFALSLSLAKRNCRIVLAGDAAQTRSVSQQIKSALAISSHGTVSEVSLIPPVFFYCVSLGRLHFSCVPEFKVFNKKTPVSFFEKGGSRKIVLQKENAEPGHGGEREFSFSLRNLSEPLAVLLVANENLTACMLDVTNAVAAVLPGFSVFDALVTPL